MRPGLALLGLALMLGCAPAAPLLSGGRTTPHGRTDLALGSAMRVPVGDLVAQPTPDDLQTSLAYAAPGGVAPLGFVRHGITREMELGVEIVGTTLRGSLRGELDLGSDVRLVLGALPLVGMMAQGDQNLAVRAGGLVPAVISVDLTGLYELWIGIRAGLEHLFGELSAREISLSGLRTGGVVGLGVGFRHLHLLVELAVDHEYWWGHLGDSAIQRNGVSLTPAFALRLRM